MLLDQPHGSFWRGSAAELVVTDRWKRAHRYGQPQWEFLLSRLLAGELQAAVLIDDQQVRGQALVNYRLHEIRINEANLQMPAERVAAYLPILVPAKVSGLVSLRSTSFLVGRNALTGTAIITWRRATTGLSAVKPVGDYTAHISATGKRVEVALDTAGGPLVVRGCGYWSAQDGLTFNGSAWGLSDHEGELEAVLKLLGQKAGGVYQMRIGTPALRCPSG